MVPLDALRVETWEPFCCGLFLRCVTVFRCAAVLMHVFFQYPTVRSVGGLAEREVKFGDGRSG